MTPDEQQLLGLAAREFRRKGLNYTVTSSVLKVWRPGSTAPEREISVPAPVNAGADALAASPDGRLVASGYQTVRVWSTKTWRPVAALRGHKSRVVEIAFSADGSRVATAGEDMTARVWGLPGGTELVRIEHTAAVYGVSFTRDGDLITGCSSANDKKRPFGGLQRIDLRTRRFVEYELPGGTRPMWMRTIVSPDGELLVAALRGPAAGYAAFAVFDLARATFRRVVVAPGGLFWGARALYSRDGRKIVLELWDRISIRDARTWRQTKLIPRARVVALLADGRLLCRAYRHSVPSTRIDLSAVTL